MDRKPELKNWSVNDYDDLLAGVRDAAELRVLDRRGMTVGLAAALDTGAASYRLMSLLADPAAGEGESALARVEELLGELVEQGREEAQWRQAVTPLLLRLLRSVDPEGEEAAEAAPPTPTTGHGSMRPTRRPGRQQPAG